MDSMLMHPQIVPRRCHCMNIGAAARVGRSCTCSCMCACLRLNAAHQHGCTHHYGFSNYCCRLPAHLCELASTQQIIFKSHSWIFNGGSTFNFAIVFLCELIISSRFVCSVLTEFFLYIDNIYFMSMYIWHVLIFFCSFECICLSHIMNIPCNCKNNFLNNYIRNMV